ncbi:MAG: hypothetical protein QXN95_03795 [Candidatus Bathyarchaeia archaeon]
MANPLLQITGMILTLCGIVVVNFFLALYISVKKLGGNIERKDALVIISVALTLLLGGILFYYLGGLTA